MNPATVVTQDVKLKLYTFFGSIVDGWGASPEEHVVWIDVSGKRGLYRRWIEGGCDDPASSMSYSTFKLQLKKYEQDKQVS